MLFLLIDTNNDKIYLNFVDNKDRFCMWETISYKPNKAN